MGEVIDFGKAWEARHPEAESYILQLTLNELAAGAEPADPTIPYDQKGGGISHEFWLRDIAERMLAMFIKNKGKPLGKGIMDDYNRLTPQDQGRVEHYIKEQGGQ